MREIGSPHDPTAVIVTIQKEIGSKIVIFGKQRHSCLDESASTSTFLSNSHQTTRGLKVLKD